MQIIFSQQPGFQVANLQPKKSIFVPSAQFPNFPEYSDLKEFFAASDSHFQVQVTHVTQHFPERRGLSWNDLSIERRKCVSFCTSCWAKSIEERQNLVAN